MRDGDGLGLGAARCRPGAGRARGPAASLPVVGVWPWRTSRTSVAGGGFGRRGHVAAPTYSSIRGFPRTQSTAEVVACRACPRLVAWREQVGAGEAGRVRRRGVLGPARARLRRSRRRRAGRGPGPRRPRRQPHRAGVHRRPLGRLAVRALHRAGLANQPTSVDRDDGLRLTGAYITAAVRCAPPANKPTPAERDTCRPYLDRELALLTGVRVIVCLGAFAYEVLTAPQGVRPRPRFGHGRGGAAGRTGARILCSFHPSQQNTFTGKLTEPMLDAVFTRAVALAAG